MGGAVSSLTRVEGSDIRRSFFPLDGRGRPPEGCAVHRDDFSVLNSESFTLTTKDGVDLDACWCPSLEAEAAVVIFHGNGCVINSMFMFADFYHSRGFSVLLVTIRGYPGSDGSCVSDGELGLYLDAEAASSFVLEKGFAPDRVVCHGYSLGGALAAKAGALFGVNVVLDHTFGSAALMVEARARRMHAWLPAFIPSWVAQSLVQDAFPPGVEFELPASDLRSGGVITTDSMDTIRKLDGVIEKGGDVFVFVGSDDKMIPASVSDALCQGEFGRASPQVAEERRSNQVATVRGGHGMFFANEPSAVEKFDVWLEKKGLGTAPVPCS